jgi:hypothetical protein
MNLEKPRLFSKKHKSIYINIGMPISNGGESQLGW